MELSITYNNEQGSVSSLVINKGSKIIDEFNIEEELAKAPYYDPLRVGTKMKKKGLNWENTHLQIKKKC